MAFGAPVDAKNDEGRTPLTIATREGSIEIMELLISKGANLKATDSKGHNLLMYALTAEKIRLLVKKGVNMEDTPAGLSILFQKVLQGEEESVKELMRLGAKTYHIINQPKSKSFFNPLHFTAQTDTVDVKMISTLIEAGIDPNSDSTLGTPLMVCRTVEKVKRLIELGANVNQTCNTMNPFPRVHSPLSASVWSMAPMGVIDELLKNGADPHYVEPYTRNNLIHFVVHEGFPVEYVEVMVKKLIALGVDINGRNITGKSPVDIARSIREWKIEKVLIAAGGKAYVVLY